jgi:membrane-associated protein
MHYRTFVAYNVVGGLLWGAGITTLGYYLGKVEFIKNNLEVAAIIIVAISVLPMLFEYVRHRRAAPGTVEAEESIVLD